MNVARAFALAPRSRCCRRRRARAGHRRHPAQARQAQARDGASPPSAGAPRASAATPAAICAPPTNRSALQPRLHDTEAKIAKGNADLAALRARRAARSLAQDRAELAALLRAAYAIGDDAPLKLMLAQDKVADANRLLAYHGYLQRERVRKISALAAELTKCSRSKCGSWPRAGTSPPRAAGRAQLAEVNRDRSQRATLVAQPRQEGAGPARARTGARARAKALQACCDQLRAAAARAERERREAAERARAPPSRPGARERSRRRPRPSPTPRAAPIQVGGLGWPLSGSAACALRRGTLPDGRRSSGLLIAAAGTPVRAVADGRVVFAEWMSGYGLICILDHGNGDMSLYATTTRCCATSATTCAAATRSPASAIPAAGAGRAVFRIAPQRQPGRSGGAAARALKPPVRGEEGLSAEDWQTCLRTTLRDGLGLRPDSAPQGERSWTQAKLVLTAYSGFDPHNRPEPRPRWRSDTAIASPFPESPHASYRLALVVARAVPSTAQA